MKNTKLFLELSSQAKEALCDKNLKDAIDKMQAMLYQMPDTDIEDELNSLSNAFEGMLSCVRKGIQDENREQSFKQMHAQGWNIYYNLFRNYKCLMSETPYQKAYQRTVDASPYWMIYNYFVEYKDGVIDDNEHAECYTMLFNQLWTAGELTKGECDDLRTILTSDNLLIEDSLLTVSALMLSAIEFPTNQKLALLNECCLLESTEMQARAMVSMVLLTFTLTQHKVFDQELAKFSALMNQKENQAKLTAILSCIYDSYYVNVFNEDFRKKIMPQLRKQAGISTQDSDKDDTFKIAIDLQAQESGLTDPVKAMEDMRISGKDIYYTAFVPFKTFPFFKNIANWLYPFYKHHKETQKTISPKQKHAVMEFLLDNSPFCDNDKWSSYFMFQSSQLSMQLPEGVELPNIKLVKTWNDVCFNYIHDLYRFFCTPYVNFAIHNPFKEDYINPTFYPDLFGNLERNHQIEIANKLIEYEEMLSAVQILESLPMLTYRQYKMLGYCYQSMEEYGKAISYYKKSLAEKEETSVKKRLAACYRENEDWQEATDLLTELATIDSRNALKYQLRAIGCLIRQERYEDALKPLYKIEFDHPRNRQALRHIVWCNLQIQRADKAAYYWEMIEDKSAQDWLNGGHAYWGKGDSWNAISCYKNFFEKNKDKEKATKQFLSDAPTLKLYGINDTDIKLMLQALGH